LRSRSRQMHEALRTA